MKLSYATLRKFDKGLTAAAVVLFALVLVITSSPGSRFAGYTRYLGIAGAVCLIAAGGISLYLSKFRKWMPIPMSDQGIKVLRRLGVSTRNSRNGCYVTPPRGMTLVSNHNLWLPSAIRNSSGDIIAVLQAISGQYEVADATHYEVRLTQGRLYITGTVYDNSDDVSGPVEVLRLQPSKIDDFESPEQAMRPLIEEADSYILNRCAQTLYAVE
jgi:hypothetical protein